MSPDHLPVELGYVVQGHCVCGSDLLTNMFKRRVPEVEELRRPLWDEGHGIGPWHVAEGIVIVNDE